MDASINLPTKEGALVREVKTTRRQLPTPDEICLRLPRLFAQAASYRAMLEVLPEYNGQLITAEVSSSTLKTVQFNLYR